MDNRYSAIIKVLGFERTVDVQQRISIADVFPKSRNRHGIYLLVFSDGLFYIGKTNNFVKRFTQHKKNHPDIIEFYYQLCRRKDLDSKEQELIHQAQSLGLPLTNIVHVSSVLGETDLDLIFSEKEQTLWLDNNLVDMNKNLRVNNGEQRLRYRHKYEKFRAYPEFEAVTELLHLYVQTCIPVPHRTELTFWSASCLPSTNANTYPRFSCISINTMETFVVGYVKSARSELWMFMIVSEQAFRKGYPRDKKFTRLYPSAYISKSNYQAAGPDQLSIEFDKLEEMIKALRQKPVQYAAKVINLRLMRKGATIQHRYHCFDLADRLLAF